MIGRRLVTPWRVLISAITTQSVYAGYAATMMMHCCARKGEECALRAFVGSAVFAVCSVCVEVRCRRERMTVDPPSCIEEYLFSRHFSTRMTINEAKKMPTTRPHYAGQNETLPNTSSHTAGRTLHNVE